MQTPAEAYLIKSIQQKLKESKNFSLINLGAGKSSLIEEKLAEVGNNFSIDRVDIEEGVIDAPGVKNCFIGNIEKMPQITTGYYDLAFANYVMEHLLDLDATAKEIYRILKPHGTFIATLANPQAPEFAISKHTPLWLHQKIKGRGLGHEAFATHYAYKDLPELIKIFKASGFVLEKINYYSFTRGYLYRFPLISQFSRAYDCLVNYFKIKKLSGNVYLEFSKN